MTAAALARDGGFLEAALLRLVDGAPGGAIVIIIALLTAAGIGALHALGPGHGKALIGAYLAGSQGRPRDALALGGLVAVMHSGSVLVLGTTFYATQRMPGGDALGPVLQLLSAIAITAVGVGLVARQVRQRRGERTPVVAHDHAQGHATDDHDHAVAHHHASLPDGVAPLSRSGVLALATSGGLLPSPAAFLVLATALAAGRSAYGLALVAAFSIGLAATLTGVGLAIISGRRVLAQRVGRRGIPWITTTLPLVSAVAVLLGGLVLAVFAVTRLV